MLCKLGPQLIALLVVSGKFRTGAYDIFVSVKLRLLSIEAFFYTFYLSLSIRLGI